MKHIPTLSALFSFPGFRARNRLQGIFGDPQGLVGHRGVSPAQDSDRLLTSEMRKIYPHESALNLLFPQLYCAHLQLFK